MSALGQDIIDRYVKAGWTGQALAQRVARHARLLEALDPGTADALRLSRPVRNDTHRVRPRATWNTETLRRVQAKERTYAGGRGNL